MGNVKEDRITTPEITLERNSQKGGFGGAIKPRPTTTIEKKTTTAVKYRKAQYGKPENLSRETKRIVRGRRRMVEEMVWGQKAVIAGEKKLLRTGGGVS